MVRNILSNRLFIGLLILVICAVAGIYLLQMQPPDEPIIIYKPVEVEQPVVPKPPPGETAESGHWHGDEWHDEPHETHAPPAAPAVSGSVPPGAVTTPDFPPVDANDDPVAAAYKRLDYISKNPYAWGGVHSERATELIAELMPARLAADHSEGDERILLISELTQQNDPRAAEALIALMIDGGVGAVFMEDALEAIGPPAVPYILPYLEKGVAEGGYIGPAVFYSLGRIGVLFRDDLGGIVDHIIIPKLAVIAADEDAEFYKYPAQRRANEVLTQLGR
ncbi:hypothetical protein F4167_05440 [Candidatus Poribacteria bacterium]|nr:hypothetical protein [Candidatus Poribacteria bacterium]